MISWPDTLPDLKYPTADWNWTETPSNPAISSSMASGADRIRKRFTSIPKQVDFTLPLLDRDQVDTLWDFYTNVLDIAQPFQHATPSTREDADWYFLQPPAFTPVGNDWWAADLTVMLVP